MRNFLTLLARYAISVWRSLLGLFRSHIHGDARWMGRTEGGLFLHREHQGLALSPLRRLSVRTAFNHLALVAPTGSGKTTRLVVPNVLLTKGSLVVTDPSGELFRLTSGHLASRGYRVQILAPASPNESAAFNPLAFWHGSQQRRELAELIGRSVQGQGSDPFWTLSAVNVLWIGLMALPSVTGRDSALANLANLRWVLSHVGEDGSRGIDAFMERQLVDRRSLAEYRAFRAQDGRVRSSVLATARAALDLWCDPDVCRVTAANTLDIAALRRERTVIYVIVPEHRVQYFAPLLSLFYSACFAHCLETGQNPSDLPIYFMLDEFGNLGYLPNFPSIITTLRKRRCSVTLILQDLAQLRAIYGADQARTIFSGGCGNKLFFAGVDLETAEYVERMLGQNTEYDTTFGGVDHRARTIGVPLLRADEVRRMPADQAILISGRERPIKLRMPPYFRVPEMRRMTEKPPANLAASRVPKEVQYIDFSQFREAA